MPMKPLLLLILASLPFCALAQSDQERGLEIAVEADRRDTGFQDSRAAMKMILRNRQGDESIRLIRVRTLEQLDDGDKSLTIFDKPADVKGTNFLTFTHKTGPDDQWLYLPALKRVKRISSNNKSGPFMGSEFAYEDLSSQEVNKYTYKYVKGETVLGVTGHVIERTPVDPNSGYARQRVWIEGSHWRTEKIEYYDRKNELLKTLTYSGYRQYSNGKWRADEMKMVNHQSGKRTTLYWKDIKFGINVSSRDFDKNALKRIR